MHLLFFKLKYLVVYYDKYNIHYTLNGSKFITHTATYIHYIRIVTVIVVVLKADLDAQKSKQNNLWKVLANKVNRKAMLIGIGCMFFQQMSGINIVIFFMNSIFGNASVEHTIDSEISSIIIGIIQVYFVFLTVSF